MKKTSDKIYWRDRIPKMEEEARERYPGFLERSTQDEILKPRSDRKVPDSTYRSFYNEAQGVSLVSGVQTEDKRNLLIRYFPKRFGDEGKQSVEMMDQLAVNKLFKEIIKYTKKRLKNSLR